MDPAGSKLTIESALEADLSSSVVHHNTSKRALSTEKGNLHVASSSLNEPQRGHTSLIPEKGEVMLFIVKNKTVAGEALGN